ncbi:MAG: hypothetical protein PUB34_01210 [Clostridia bacterium]|nr:hypothetical protein [Clostridia bacterium]
MEDKVLFRNKGRGYNKDDVNEYIISENRRFSQIDSNYRRLLQEKEQIIEGFNNELLGKNKELSELQASIAQKDALIEEYKNIIEENAETIEELNKKLVSLPDNSSVNIAFDENSVSSHEANTKDNIEQIQERIDEILNHAKKEAIRIINTAIEASHKYELSQNDIDAIKKDISGRSSSFISELKKNLHFKLK